MKAGAAILSRAAHAGKPSLGWAAAALLAAAALAGLAGCASPGLDRRDPGAESEVRAQEALWGRYHWYYPEISHSLTLRWETGGFYSGPLAHVRLRMSAMALTQEGASQVGVLHLEGWNTAVQGLYVVHLDSAGRRVPVPMKQVMDTFRKRGLVVVPKVGRGSTVTVELKRGPFSSIDFWELSMDRSVPVLKSEVRIAAGKGLLLETHAYNGLEGPVLESRGRFAPPARIWTARAVMPLAGLPFADAMTARPRLLLTNSSNASGTRLSTWKAVAREKRKRDFDPGLLNLSAETRAQASALADGAGASDTAKARRLLAWVQDKVTPVPEKAGGWGLDGVLERRKGTEAQVAALFAAMCRAAGLQAEIVLSRQRGRGGLDTAAANPGAAETPLVVVRADGREWAAFPQSPCFGLGDYPAGFAGMHALSLETGRLRPLPEPAHGTSFVSMRQEVSLEGAPLRKAAMELQGPAAAQARRQWLDALAADPLEGCRAILRELGFTAGVRKCAQRGLEDREHPFRLDLVVDAAGTWAEEGEASSWTAPDLFSRPAWFYDSARTDGYYLPQDQVTRETTVFLAAGGKGLEQDIPCRDLENALFKVTCKRDSTAAGPAFTRETALRKGWYPAAAVKALDADLAELDRIRAARLTVRR